MIERLFIRIFISVTLGLAFLVFFLVPIPIGTSGDLALPALAMQQPILYRLEVALLVFYGLSD